MVNKELEITMINKVAIDLCGYSLEYAMGKQYNTIFKFADETTLKPKDDFVKKTISTGEIQEMPSHTVLLKANKTHIPVADSAAPLKNKKGDVIGCVVVFRDVTKEREIDKAKTEFVSLASHQLRTPLTSIKWYAEMLLDGDAGKLTKEQKRFTREIYIGNQRMVDLVNALLNVSRIELGTFTVEPELLSIESIAISLIHEVQSQIKAKKIKFSKKIDKNLPKIKSDPKLLRMVFQNILSNAIKYTPKNGKVSMEIIKQKTDILIKVSDSGYGIPEDQKDKIFTKLFRADNIRAMDTEGTGLGLYIIKSIINDMGGKIWFESKENKGTIFYVTIPLKGVEQKKGTKTLS